MNAISEVSRYGHPRHQRSVENVFAVELRFLDAAVGDGWAWYSIGESEITLRVYASR